MLIATDTMIPWKSTNLNENLLVDFLNQGCCWKGAHTFGDKEEFFVAFARFCHEKGTTPESRGMTETRLRRLGHDVNSVAIRGVFVRTGTEAHEPESAYKPSERLAGGSAAVSFPHELPILPTDDPIVAEQKRKHNESLKPKPRVEIAPGVFEDDMPPKRY